jgi:hypothetical protein
LRWKLFGTILRRATAQRTHPYREEEGREDALVAASSSSRCGADVAVRVFDEMKANPTDVRVRASEAPFRTHGADSLVAVGGGSGLAHRHGRQHGLDLLEVEWTVAAPAAVAPGATPPVITVHSHGDRPALVVADEAVRWSYVELDARARAAALGLLGLGLRRRRRPAPGGLRRRLPRARAAAAAVACARRPRRQRRRRRLRRRRPRLRHRRPPAQRHAHGERRNREPSADARPQGQHCQQRSGGNEAIAQA